MTDIKNKKVKNNYQDKNTKFYISELSKSKKEEYKVNDNIEIKPIYVKGEIGQMLICTIKALNYYLKYIKKNDFKLFGYYRIVLGALVLVYFAIFSS